MLKIVSSVITVSMLSLFIAGCTKNAEVEEKRSVDFACKQEGVLAPKWTCIPEVEDSYASVGIAQKSAAGTAYMRKVALANGRSELASQIDSQVKNKITLYTGTTGAMSGEKVDKSIESVSKQISNVDLSGSKAVDMWNAPSGAIYMLVTVSKESANKEIRNNLKTSFKNDEALWQQFRAKNALESLEKEFSND